MQKEHDLTQLLVRRLDGDSTADGAVLPIIYDHLRQLAARQLHRERRDHTLQPTALAHEAYLRLRELNHIDISNTDHFFALASTMIRRILVDHARAANRLKRGRDAERFTLTTGIADAPTNQFDLLALDDALEKLAAMDNRQSQIVELRFFGGLTVPQVAGVLNLSERTVKSEWSAAKAWLYDELAQI
jgi:RNA polymerase sigma factor (TIGR02999 family)